MITETTTRLQSIGQQIEALRKEAREIRRSLGKGKVQDYLFETPSGPKRLSELFGNKSDLMVVHNMGRFCDYCSLWADGLNGSTKHLQDRAAFVLSSPDPIDRLAETARTRGWEFPLASAKGSTFFKDMGFEDPSGSPEPGFSTFRRDSDGTVRHIASDSFGPGDDYCAVWHLFESFEGGVEDWEPIKFPYPNP